MAADGDTEQLYPDYFPSWVAFPAAVSALLLGGTLSVGMVSVLTSFPLRPISAVTYSKNITLLVWACLIVGFSTGTAVSAAYWHTIYPPVQYTRGLRSATSVFLSSLLVATLVLTAVGFFRPILALCLLVVAFVLTFVGPLLFLSGLLARDGEIIALSLFCLVFWVGNVWVTSLNGRVLTIEQSITLYGIGMVVLLTPLLTPLMGANAADNGNEDMRDERTASHEETEASDDEAVEGPATEPSQGGGSEIDGSRSSREVLRDIDGIGDAKKSALYSAGFETVADLRQASASELTRAEGVGDALAGRITDEFKDESVSTDSPSSHDAPLTSELLTDIEPLETRGHLTSYHARLLDGDEDVRVVSLAPDIDAEEQFSDAFQSVVRKWYNACTHPNVVTVREWDKTPRPWVAVEADPRHVRLSSVASDLSVAETIDALVDCTEAVRNVALYNTNHYNLSPACVWVAEGDDTEALVDDWGLKRTCHEHLQSEFVTPYTAPEQLTAVDDRPDRRTDVYGLGAVAYHALTGQQPVEAEGDAILSGNIAPPSSVAAVPTDLDEPILRALSIDPDDRYSSAYDFGRALQPIQETVN